MNKLFKILLLFVAAVSIASCDGPMGYAIHVKKTDNHVRRYNTNDEVEDDTIRFVINKVRRQMLMKAEVNGVEDTVLYDSGAAPAVIQFYTKATQPKGMKFYRMPVMGADKTTKVKMTMIPAQIKTPMCIVEHLGNAMLVSENHSCEKEPTISDYTIIGLPGLDMWRYAIDFTKNQIYQVNDMSLMDTTEYVPVKCKFEKTSSANRMYVYPIVNGVEYECIFDTGNGGGIFILDAQRVENHGDVDDLIEGSYGKTIGGVTGMQRFVRAPENKVEFAGREETVPVMYFESNLVVNNVGLQYIKRFDWIIEHRYNPNTEVVMDKVYAKPHVADTMEMSMARYGISSADGKLKIMSRLIDGNEVFKVGDQIVSVNGEKITEENICYYYDLLTENKDWSEFDVKVK